jgi:identified by metaGeneAnnotator|nr:MAG TPA: terminase small subunit [Caudoviricetes sp.]DAO68865.1 MAG TPA: terminase small subunit [Caudoviricetes sp.]
MSDKKRPVGRPTTYSQETADKICELIARGMSLRAICASADMPAGGTVHRWLAEHQDFQEQYARAREEQADGFADEIIDIADSVAPETGEVAKAKLQIDARKWKAAKLAPKKYGEKLELDADMRVKVETRSLEDIFE